MLPAIPWSSNSLHSTLVLAFRAQKIRYAKKWRQAVVRPSLVNKLDSVTFSFRQIWKNNPNYSTNKNIDYRCLTRSNFGFHGKLGVPKLLWLDNELSMCWLAVKLAAPTTARFKYVWPAACQRARQPARTARWWQHRTRAHSLKIRTWRFITKSFSSRWESAWMTTNVMTAMSNRLNSWTRIQEIAVLQLKLDIPENHDYWARS